MRAPSTSTSLTLSWGDSVLVTKLMHPGERFSLSPEIARADFVIPGVERHSVRVDGSGEVIVDSDGRETRLTIGEARSVSIGALTLALACLPESAPRPGFACHRIWRDVALLAAALAYAVLVAFRALGTEPGLADLDVFSRTSDFGLATVALSDARLGSREDSDAVWWPAPSEPPLPSAGQHMLLPEEPAQARGATQPRERGRRVAPKLADRRPGGSGARARLGQGPIGNPRAPVLAYAWALPGWERPHPSARRSSPAPAVSAWGFTLSDSTWDWASVSDDAPAGSEQVVAPFGEADARGQDDRSALGNMFGPEPADPRGVGLGVSGFAPGGGGRAASIGLGVFGDAGHGAGSASGQGAGVAESASPFNRSAKLGVHEPRAPELSPRVDRNAVARELGRNARRIASCLGRLDSVEIELTVEADGAPSDVSVAPASAQSCVRRVVSELRFAPAGTAFRVRSRVTPP